jgi:hypothetical protein
MCDVKDLDIKTSRKKLSLKETYINLTREFLINSSISNLVLHTSNVVLNNFNKYAKKSLEFDNEDNKRSKDEALSIHIITDKLNTRLNILYEK